MSKKENVTGTPSVQSNEEKLASLVNERLKGLSTLCKQTESVLQSTHKLASANLPAILKIMREHGKGDDFIASTLKLAMEFLNDVKLDSSSLQVIDKLGKRRQVKLDLREMRTPEAMAFKCLLSLQDAVVKIHNALG